MKVLKVVAGAATAAIISGGAWASSISLDYNGASAGGYDRVNVTSTVGPNGSSIDGRNILAGGFKMEDTRLTSDSLGDFVAWCLDLGAYLGSSGLYELTDSPFSNSELNALGTARVQRVFDANFGASKLTSRSEAAGFQAALWEVVYDSDYDLSGGDFMVNGGNANASSYLLAAKNYSGPKVWNLSFLQSNNDPRRQNLVTATPVPLPAAGFMLLAAMGGLAGLRRRRKER